MNYIEVLLIKFGINLGFLTAIANNPVPYYKRIVIPKNNNGIRVLYSPSIELKAIQRWLKNELLDKVPINTRATGFVKGRNIKTNALFHVNNKYILTLDIRNFFPSISKQIIANALIEKIGIDSVSAGLISGLCTVNGYLPQGAPTSPVLSNIVMDHIDLQIIKYCNSKRVVYSRYADDLAISGKNISQLNDCEIYIRDTLAIELKLIINNKKRRLYTGKYANKITGVVINSKKTTVGRGYKRIIRAEIHARSLKKLPKHSDSQVHGMISFVCSIEADYKVKIKKYMEKLSVSIA